MKTYHLEISLNDIEPKIFRAVKINSDNTLFDLHNAIQLSMGWFNCHLHEFQKGKDRYGINDPDGWGEPVIDESTVKLSDVFKRKNSKITYLYDFGDDWSHTIKLIDVEEELTIFPVCIEGTRACPLEDIGGAHGYMNFLEVIKNPKHPEYENMVEWSYDEDYDEPFNPEKFDIEFVNEVMVRFFSDKEARHI